VTGQTAQYLVVIYGLEQRDGPPVPTGRIARVLDRSPSAATEMIQRLAENCLVEHEPYSGVELTAAGRERAADLYASHETLCRFFRDVLGLEEYAQEALTLAGVVDSDITHRLETTIIPRTEPQSGPLTPLSISNDQRC
jgi:DtxR family Mn-dependent transcriptional regulator